MAYLWVKSIADSFEYTKSLQSLALKLQDLRIAIEAVPSKRIHHHEDHFVKRCRRWWSLSQIFILRKAGEERLIGKEAGCECD